MHGGSQLGLRAEKPCSILSQTLLCPEQMHQRRAEMVSVV